MAQIILIIIALLAFFKKNIPVTKNTEIHKPQTFILGIWALITAILAGSIPILAFYMMIFFFFILVGIFNKQKN